MSHIQPDHVVSQLSERELVRRAIAHLDHVLPAQAPIQDFVHHNTLHGYQHLPFEEALAAAEQMTGISAYHSEEKNREFYRQGRINDDDLMAAFGQNPQLQHEAVLFASAKTRISRKDIYRIVLLYDMHAISLSEMNWRIEELAALDTVQDDVPDAVRKALLDAPRQHNTDNNPVRQLWLSLCHVLELKQEALHPETLLDFSLEQTEQWLCTHGDTDTYHQQTQASARAELDDLLSDVGNGITLRGLVLALSGKDILDSVRPQLIRLCASALDEGVAAWQLPECSRLGLYGAWRQTARFDAHPYLHELSDWPQCIAELPEDAIDNIVLQLTHLNVPPERWEGYLRRLALELPGWAGMINWRQQHPGYYTTNHVVPQLADYLAIRLTLDRLWLNQICREIWKCEATLATLPHYFNKNLSEFIVRRQLYRRALPEYLSQQAQLLCVRAGSERQYRHEWQHLADLIDIWRRSPLAELSTEKSPFISVNNQCWRLFRLSQHLGLTTEDIEQLGKPALLMLLTVLDGFDLKQRRQIWLLAYERHYQEDLFLVLRANHKRGRWAKRTTRPSAQIVFCMDEREESFRRHLEELDPTLETLGAAGFFGVAMNYKGLDDNRVTPLCPIIVTPAHEVQEQPRIDAARNINRHQGGLKRFLRILNLIHHGLRRHLVLSQLLMLVLAPVALLGLLAKSFIPTAQYSLVVRLMNRMVAAVQTRLFFISTDNETAATPEQPKLGFTDVEQVDRIAGFLRNTGLTYGFSPIIILMGHGSISQNNPHLAAYDCGACSGRHGGPNARLFAAMANRPEVRAGLAARGIHISEDSWFIGAEHNTCIEQISWFDTDDIPERNRAAYVALIAQLTHIQHLSAHERCRRLASAPRNPELKAALSHIVERGADFSQARPELGHATNACAVIGRRSVSQGAFFDRRMFLISYDPTQDPDGKIVEGILLNVGPVGAGINLEYYFSTVNSDGLGCGTKVPHNIVGLFGVMEGASSDLRTGLPSQMTEIHEAMRLQLIVEAKTEILEQIYARQPTLRELIAGGWILLRTIDPDSGEIFMFERGIGFVPWQAPSKEVAIIAKSPDYYRDKSLPIPPVLIQQPELAH
ncbi:MAG: DUF2309 domain-containing protein [Gammaproteobacteria bacterium]|nr:DUF2309 domain-containing protein [Gammaproteobacteria bacterium]